MGPSKAFDSRVTYAVRGDVYCNDGREVELLRQIFSLPAEKLNKLRGNPDAILEFIDNFGVEHYMMNIGEIKGRIITSLIASHKPKTAFEFGGYVAYSTILFASTLQKIHGNDARYYSLELDPMYASIIMALVDLAGLRAVVHVIIGDSSESLKRLAASGVKPADFVLFDHKKLLYTHDLKIAEQLGMIKVGTLIVADNMTDPGNPPYDRYLRLNQEEKEAEMEKGEYGDLSAKGNPKLVYENESIDSYEPNGDPDSILVSRCIKIKI